MASLLVIDDDRRFLEALEGMLQRAGHRVRTAENGSRCLELLDGERTDVLITDILMPESDGIETIRRVRRQFPNLKIIAISGGGLDGKSNFLRSAKLLGADETLAKPFRPATLTRAVERCLETARLGEG